MLTLIVPGVAEPQGSARAFIVGGRARITSDNKDLKSWRTAVKTAAFVETRGTIRYATGAVRVEADFALPIPLGKQYKRKTWPYFTTTKPDVDKLARALLDALTGVAFTDDAQVAILSVTKRYVGRDDAPCTTITVDRIEEA